MREALGQTHDTPSCLTITEAAQNFIWSRQLVLLLLSLLMAAGIRPGTSETRGADAALEEALLIFASESRRSEDEVGKYLAAITAFEEVADSYLGTETALTARAMQGYVEILVPGDFEEGIAPLLEVVEAAPGTWQSAFCHVFLGLQYCNRGTLETELEVPDIEAAIANYDAARIHEQVAMQELPRLTEEAWRPLQEIGQMPPKEYIVAGAHLVLGGAALELGYLDEAIRELQTVVLEFPDSGPAPIAMEHLNKLGLTVIGTSSGFPAAKPERSIALVSVREYLCLADLTVHWDSPTRQATFNGNRLRVILDADSGIVEINGTKSHLSAKPKLVHGKLRVPEAFLRTCIASIHIRGHRSAAVAGQEPSREKVSQAIAWLARG